MADDEQQASERESAEQASKVVSEETSKESVEEASKEAAEQLRAIKVADLLVQAASGLISLGSVRLAGDQRDLAQARLAIDSLRALEPVVREQLSVELADELQRAVSGMQLAFADAVNEQAMPAGSAASAPEPEDAPAEAGDPETGK